MGPIDGPWRTAKWAVWPQYLFIQALQEVNLLDQSLHVSLQVSLHQEGSIHILYRAVRECNLGLGVERGRQGTGGRVCLFLLRPMVIEPKRKVEGPPNPGLAPIC